MQRSEVIAKKKMFIFPEDDSWVGLPSFTKHTSNVFRACKTLQSVRITAAVPQIPYRPLVNQRQLLLFRL